MRKLNLLLITAMAVLGLVGNASAAVLNWEGTNRIRVGDFAEADFTGGGVATINGSNGTIPAHLQTLRLAASRGNINGEATRFVTDPEAAGNQIASVQFIGVEVGTGTFSPISGVLESTATPGAFNGQMPVAGLVRLCLLSTECNTFAGLPLTTMTTGGNTIGVGIGGLLTFTILGGFARLSIEANPWSIKTVTVKDEQTTPVNGLKQTVTLTLNGFAHDPASGTTNTADVGGVVQLVSQSQVLSNLPTGSNDKIASAQTLFIRFIPEPGMLLLIGSGAAGLALLGRKRMRT